MLLAGCGTTSSQSATEQLLLSNAVDKAVSQIDFGILGGQRVYLDTQYLKHVKGQGFVNADYVVSSLRQQLVAAGCLLQDDKDNADFIVEPRVGALGTNAHEVVYGLPQNNSVNRTINTAASMVPTVPAVPPLPELALGKKNSHISASKIAVFAYHRETRQPVWQSGIAKGTSDARSLWILGGGPFEQGSIYDGTRFAGSKLEIPLPWLNDKDEDRISVDYFDEYVFKNRPENTWQPVTNPDGNPVDGRPQDGVAGKPKNTSEK